MLFRYTAINREGAVSVGEREAADEKTLARTLRGEGFMLASAKPARTAVFSWLPVFRAVSLVDKMTFARNLAVMVGAGLPMIRALEASEEQVTHAKFRAVIGDLRERITKGSTFSQSLAKHREIFGDFFIHMVEAGEMSGKLESSLKLLARQMKRDHDLATKVKSAMIYPAIIVVTLLGIGIVMLMYVVPTLSQTFKELGVALPVSTQVIIAFSDSFARYGLFLGTGFALLAYGTYRFLWTEYGALLFDRIVLHIPVFGPLVQKFNSARLARTLASLIAAGLSITKALDITSRVVGNARFRSSLAAAIIEIERGRPLSSFMRSDTALYAPLFTQMIAVGEETGTLARMLLRVALFYEEEVTAITKNLSSIIEPVMMIVIGLIVGFFAISMIQPLYSSLGQVGL